MLIAVRRIRRARSKTQLGFGKIGKKVNRI
jgi:hypothetical protein